MTQGSAVHEAMQNFAASVTKKMNQLTVGEPEDQLRSPFENLMSDVAASLGWKVVCTGETPLPDQLGRPDFAVHLNQLLAGYVELKAPGTGATANRFKGHNRKQFKRFSAIPNILYTDGNEWALYRSGKLVDKVMRLSGDVATDGKNAAAPKDAQAIEHLLRDFLSWEPFIPIDRRGKINLKGFAALLAPLTRMLRDDVTDALKKTDTSFVKLANEWRELLFPEASDAQFADAYAQTVAFALLLGRTEGADPLDLRSAEIALEAHHNLLSNALEVLTSKKAREEAAASLDILLRVIGEVHTDSFSESSDPWLHFYEDFLAEYDPKLRKEAGAYYTPVEVVHCQVRLVDDLLVNRLEKPHGFADPSVKTLDPATGTGTYLIGVIDHALERTEKEQGVGAVAGQATALAKNLYGFELMVGPYAVSELRVSSALRGKGATPLEGGTQVYLTDTLESPHADLPHTSIMTEVMAEQHTKALKIKLETPVIVCLGNPPYGRHEAATEKNRALTGSWVRWGAKDEITPPILNHFIDPAKAAGHGVHVKNLYNQYVYFFRWAFWKVLEQKNTQGPGVISFITASSYLDGDAFCGMREHMRRQCDEIWILDLGGEGRGTRKTDNVFAIQTPVCIAVAVRSDEAKKENPAIVHYSRIEGTRAAKLAALDSITDFAKVQWEDCSDEWLAPFRPSGKGEYFTWPLLTDLMPWQHSGSQVKRTWPICSDAEVLKQRWRVLLTTHDQAEAFKETRDRKISSKCSPLWPSDKAAKRIDQVPPDAPAPRIERYAYRSFDRQWVFADSRLGDYLRPDLWRAHSDRQVYLTSLLYNPLGQGPAATACSLIPDLHHFCNRGAKDSVPLFRTADASEANISLGLLDLLGNTHKHSLTPEDFLAYVYGALAQPAFTTLYAKELETCELRVPITKDFNLFEKVRKVGARLLWLHTYGERFIPEGEHRGHIPPGLTKCVNAIPGDADSYPESFYHNDTTQTLHVGEGKFAPVRPEIFEFEVSGLKVVQSWLKYRMKNGAGKKSSPLDDIRPERWTSQFTTELLELIWVLEATVAGYPYQAELLESVIEGDCFLSDKLPEVPPAMRKPPVARKSGGDLFEGHEADE